MNYYNPYFFTTPLVTDTTRTSLFSRLFGGLTFGRVLNGTQRALTFANQAIPFVKQVKPIIGNAKTIFKVMNEFKKTESPRKNRNKNLFNTNYSINNDNKFKEKTSANNDVGPTFFI